MYAQETSRGEAVPQERRDAAQNDKRILGHVVHCDGARATIAAFADTEDGTVTGLWTVGRMISINLGSARTVGLVYAIGKADLAWNQDEQNAIEVSVELVGEVRDREAPAAAGVRPRHHRLSAYRRRRAPHPRSRPAGGLRSRRPPLDHHRPAVAGRNDRGAHRHRRHAGAPLRDRRHDRRRQVDGRVAAACARRSRRGRTCAC